MEASVSLKKIGKVLNSRSILSGLSFGIERGSMTVIVGDNDAGKSTLLKVIAGIAKPEFGNVFVNGLDVRMRKNETSTVVGYMPQSPDFDCQLTIRQNLIFQGMLHNLDKDNIRRRVRKLADTFEISEYLDDFPESLSRGLLKRAMLIKALIHNPEILLLDEPTSSLDIRSRYIVWNYLLSKKGNKTIIFTTQYIEEAERIHDRIVIMHRGKVILDGTLDKLLSDTGELHHFQIHFELLPDELYDNLIKLTTLVSPSKIGEIFDFYARERKVLFDVIRMAIESELVDYRADKVGLETLILTSRERLHE
ncbi:MAG: ABC transporter ATP-binding protein [Candidatus Marinimicrobia bacterium]|jgi:ABC-type multidrug transport system ATPase subunit|nr:ABC transporter ATP-binding protein [Candidatus Neomarinimicrobiota bacterium]MDP6837125.1 ABC transporter ATP-binding protein [Candidatus Neomarinimicrobiota bacterium]|tara:strand:+ start:372 stop:1295 length:924 start_codon:yes stop_codon:yes gene_type:complete